MEPERLTDTDTALRTDDPDPSGERGLVAGEGAPPSELGVADRRSAPVLLLMALPLGVVPEPGARLVYEFGVFG